MLEIYLKILFGFLLLADAADASAATVDEEEEASRGSSSPTEEEEAEEEEATDIASASSSAHHQGGRTRWGNLSWSSTISHTHKNYHTFLAPGRLGDWSSCQCFGSAFIHCALQSIGQCIGIRRR